jgi:hypothetical protein
VSKRWDRGWLEDKRRRGNENMRDDVFPSPPYSRLIIALYLISNLSKRRSPQIGTGPGQRGFSSLHFPLIFFFLLVLLSLRLAGKTRRAIVNCCKWTLLEWYE